LLEQVLEAARWGPSWTNSQCWRFVVVTNNEIKARLADTTSPGNRAGEGIRSAPVLIVACAQLGQSGYFHGGDAATDKGDWFMFDVALAMQNLVLAAHALGLGTVYVGAFDAPEAGRILNVPDGYRVVAMTPLGYPDEEGRTPSRKELSEIVFYDTFGS
jgi:nitroreductase